MGKSTFAFRYFNDTPKNKHLFLCFALPFLTPIKQKRPFWVYIFCQIRSATFLKSIGETVTFKGFE